MTATAVSRRVTHCQPTLDYVRACDLVLRSVTLPAPDHSTSTHTASSRRQTGAWPGSDSDETILRSDEAVCEVSSSVGAWDRDLRQFRFDLFTSVAEFPR